MELDLSLRGRCILAAEDNEVNQLVLEHTLNEQSLPYHIVGNGKLAVEAWEILQPRMILMDISMPVMDGFEAIKIIRERELVIGNHVPIIVLTAHALKGDEDKVLAYGADCYLTKPINPDTLLNKVAEYTDEALRSGLIN